MARNDKQKHQSEKTPLLNTEKEFIEWIFHKLCKEDVFPKRSRWLIAGKIADLVNDFDTAIHRANEIRVVTQQERDLRHYYQTMAMSNLMALDAKINLAQRVLDISPETFTYYAKLANDLRGQLQAWMTADERRYGKPTSLSDAKKNDEVLTAIMEDFKQMFHEIAETVTKRYIGEEPNDEGNNR